VTIRFILVAPSHPANVGAAARAMKTMGHSSLWLVAPARFPHPEATALAAGADDVLAAARVVATLPEAIADCGLVLATSARSRSRCELPVLSPREAATRLLAAAARAGVTAEAAIVFGTERTGLSNEDLELCQAVVQIPSDPAYESLNLAQAVQILAYELRLAVGAAPVAGRRRAPLASSAELGHLRAHLAEVLVEIDFTDRLGGPHLMRRLTRLFGRVGLDRDEIGILRGILSAVQARRRRAGSER
jgi:tRNA (cytidine32/uridine32-2'-O)-methyltransferase